MNHDFNISLPRLSWESDCVPVFCHGSFGGDQVERRETRVNWLPWAILSAGFAGMTAILAKVGVKDVDSNLATAVRTTVILGFAWLVASFTNRQPLQAI